MTDFKLYSWVGSDNGKIKETEITITVCPKGTSGCGFSGNPTNVVSSTNELYFGDVYLNHNSTKQYTFTNNTGQNIPDYNTLLC